MSPLKVLGRGYAIIRRPDGAVVKSAADVKAGDRIKVRLQRDEIGATVELNSGRSAQWNKNQL
jgi:exodeoxyribonuclease VII large subunit